MTLQQIPNTTPKKMCDNCGEEMTETTTYWFNPKIKVGWDGMERLVFPHVNICPACQEQPFRQLDSGHTVSSIIGQVLFSGGRSQ